MSPVRTPQIRLHSIKKWILLHFSLIALSVIALTGFTIVTLAKLEKLEASFLREQDLIGAIYAKIDVVNGLIEESTFQPMASTETAFQSIRDLIHTDLKAVNLIHRNKKNERIITDFSNMVQSYLEYSEAAMDFRKDGRLTEANASHDESMNILELMNRQLSTLFPVIKEDSEALRQQADRVRLQILITVGVISMSVLCLAIAFGVLSFSRIISPIDELTKAAIKINDGDLNVRVRDNSRDFEFQRLAVAFNSMLDTINRQIREIEESSQLKVQLQKEESRNNKIQALVNQAELQALQSRINPHFLFNTLNMICQSAYSEQAIQSAKMIESLAAMLHYLMEDSAKPVLLADEIRHTQDYFYIQTLRFGNRISFTLDCPPALETIRVPRLVIQPIVENAIRHGAKDIVGNVQVAVIVRKENDTVSIKISDTGKGISPGDLERIRAKIADRRQPEGNIGIHNVFQRLRLYFGETATLSIFSNEGEGTTVDIRMPCSVEKII